MRCTQCHQWIQVAFLTCLNSILLGAIALSGKAANATSEFNTFTIAEPVQLQPSANQGDRFPSLEITSKPTEAVDLSCALCTKEQLLMKPVSDSNQFLGVKEAESSPISAISPISSFSLGQVPFRDTPTFEQRTPDNNPPGEEEQEEEPAPITDEAADPELGILRLRERPIAPIPPPQPTQLTTDVFLLGGINYFRSDNILLLETDPVNDQLVRLGSSLYVRSILGPRTAFIGTVGGNVTRYSALPQIDYNELEIRAGIRQFLFARTFGEVSWSNLQLFLSDGGDRFLNDHSFQLSLSRRDILLPQLFLDSFYELRFNLSDPTDRSRLINSLGTSLSYQLTPELQTSLSYQLILADFIEQDREDTYNQVLAQLIYNPSNAVRFNAFGGFSFGSSSNPAVNFDSFLFGVGFNFSVRLF